MTLEKQLVAAICKNDEEAVAQCLREGADPNTIVEYAHNELTHRASPFEWSAQYHGNLKIMQLLVDYGADIQEINSVGHQILDHVNPQLVTVLVAAWERRNLMGINNGTEDGEPCLEESTLAF